MTNDSELLQRFARDRSEPAFTELVNRYLDLVYSAALRQVNGDTHLAQDVAQNVFVDLARKAASLSDRLVLAGWLYTGARYAAARAVRTERRRQMREQEAHLMQELLHEPTPEPGWDQLRPVLDDAMHELNERDRNAVLLRFFEDRPLADVGLKLGLSEDAARMRVDRALDKLRALLARRGVTSSAAALSAVLSSQTISAAPAGLALSISGAALAASTAGTGATLTLIKLVTMTKLKAGILSAIVVAGVATTVLIQQQARAKQREQEEALRRQAEQAAQIRSENERLANLAARPAANSPGDLAALRAEAASLRQQTNDLAALQAENRRMRPEARPKSPLEIKEEQIAKMNLSKGWLLAFRIYAADHREQPATSFDQARRFLPSRFPAETNVSVDQFELVYTGSFAVERPDEIIMMREKEPWQNSDGKWCKVYGLVDGSVQVVSMPSKWRTGGKEVSFETFEEFEKSHIVPPPAQ